MAYLYSELDQYPDRKIKFDALIQRIKESKSPSHWLTSARLTSFGEGFDSYDLRIYQNKDGLDLLFYAASVGNFPAFEFFCSTSSFCNPNAVVKYKKAHVSLLWLAVESNNPKIVKSLLELVGTAEASGSVLYSQILEMLLDRAQHLGPDQRDWRMCLSLFLKKISGKIQFSSSMLSKISVGRLSGLIAVAFKSKEGDRSVLELSFPVSPKRKPDDKKAVFDAIKKLDDGELKRRLCAKILAGPNAAGMSWSDPHAPLVNFFWRSRGFLKCRKGRGILKEVEQYLNFGSDDFRYQVDADLRTADLRGAHGGSSADIELLELRAIFERAARVFSGGHSLVSSSESIAEPIADPIAEPVFHSIGGS